MENSTAIYATPDSRKTRRLLRRLGALGFWFFLLKGCVWLVSLGVAFFLATG